MVKYRVSTGISKNGIALFRTLLTVKTKLDLSKEELNTLFNNVLSLGIGNFYDK